VQWRFDLLRTLESLKQSAHDQSSIHLR
jgi:hypothetical protein